MNVRKGCFNENCIARKKKRKFKEIDDIYCPKCGSKLDYVCASIGCHRRLSSDDKRYCEPCITKQEKNKALAIKIVKAPVALAATVVTPILTDKLAENAPIIIDSAQEAAKKFLKK